jgi:hypothetical protein
MVLLQLQPPSCSPSIPADHSLQHEASNVTAPVITATRELTNGVASAEQLWQNLIS